ncbi:peptide ABC transporter ATP-binding protein [Mesotoga sp. HF07.pep.5.2.highcov]|uniref:ABC transporter ATP-binding protein n=1 Tax=unclassified Mesotoga TaxID=1184398 RepID=UPI000C1745A8|nr:MULTISPECIES: ABC transporter ATP-binding protein [unclassified Mesotoga]PIJ63692.1 peptide ABC transporter ATP-binding protein [Mesotoga sp. H07.pep.5.3]RLL92499.1 peptide ABC transporter ATP-binding protein [Mesotoga sp. HF07.pep.5.2.highcov]
MERILEVDDLKISFRTQLGKITPVDGVSFGLSKGETLGIVGESGCGKTITAFSIIRLLPKNAFLGYKTKISFRGRDISTLSKQELQKIRGKSISMVFQEPMTSLNPLYTIGWQISEVYRLHEGLDEDDAMKRSIEMLRLVGIPEPQKRVKEFPHQLSGGMRQRVMIAMALACSPELLIADEPTTALDVTIQAQVLELMNELKSKFDTATIIITHDLGVIAEMCDRVVVMYAGQIVESGGVFDIFDKPVHPYTKGLISSIPKIDVAKKDQKKLNVINGYVPHPSNFPEGCRFRPRCPIAFEKCLQQPPVVQIERQHSVRCWLFEGRDVL